MGDLVRARGLARVYQALVGTARATTFEYRAQIIIWILSFLFLLVMMFVWLAVVDEVGPAAGWDQVDFVSYYVAAAVMNYLTASWVLWDWEEDIRTGNLSVKPLKPLHPFHHYLCDQLGAKVFILVILVPAVAVAAWLLPVIQYPLTLGRVMAVVLSAIIGFALNTWSEIGFGFAVGGGWTLFFSILFRVLWRIGLRRYEAVGA